MNSRAARLLFAIARRFYPDLETQQRTRAWLVAGDIFTSLLCIPLLVWGLVWLARATHFSLAAAHWPAALILVALYPIFSSLPFFLVSEIAKGRYADMSGGLDEAITWLGIFLFGPVFLWLPLFYTLATFANQVRQSSPPLIRINQVINLAFNLTSISLFAMTGLRVYTLLGGSIPFQAITIPSILIALVGMGTQFFLSRLIWFFHLQYYRLVQQHFEPENQAYLTAWMRYTLIALFAPALALPFAILGAGLYAASGLVAFALFMGGLVMTALTINRMSLFNETNRQQSQQFTHFEQIGRELLARPADQPNLPDLLERHLPSMFIYSIMEVRLFPDQVLFRTPASHPSLDPKCLEALAALTEPRMYTRRDELSWPAADSEHGWLLAPILHPRTQASIGAIYYSRNRWLAARATPLPDSVMPVQTLAATIASAVARAEDYAVSLAYERTRQELAIAGQVQATFLPDQLPQMRGWQIEAMLEPAREASGDFYDVIALPSGKVALLVADVADKGMGAALIMALTRTLLRVYAAEHEQPARVLAATNARILADTHSDQYVTVFYALLDPATGALCYANAGHNPALLLRSAGAAEKLWRTGMPLGIFEDSRWEEHTRSLDGGESLVIYTDGITEAEDAQQSAYGMERLEMLLRNHSGTDSGAICAAVIEDVRAHCGQAHPADDITLMLLKRNPAQE